MCLNRAMNAYRNRKRMTYGELIAVKGRGAGSTQLWVEPSGHLTMYVVGGVLFDGYKLDAVKLSDAKDMLRRHACVGDAVRGK